MKKIVCLLFTTMLMSASFAQDNKVNPIIKDFGPVYELLVDLVMASSKPDTINLGIEAACTLLNLHGVGGVPKEKIKMVMAVHNAAGYTILNNEAYRARYKVDNPNLPMIKALLDAGVKIVVCGQTLKKRGIDPSTLAPGVGVATSALTTITTHQLKGYATIKW
jgi:intracellular sulfur oxidation DsrE/DsrF family protein